ncbi:MAG: integrin alpha, partial [Ignavibacteria bacterium]|nr:integrin alpha [Ignavibacteria bacterium]
MKNYGFPAVLVAALFVLYGFVSDNNNPTGFRNPENLFIYNEIINDFRIPSEGYYPEFIRNLKKNSGAQDKTVEQNIDKDWYSQAIENIKKDEYNISYSKELNAFQSPNRANNLRFVYQKDGFIVSPRTTKIPLFDMNDKTIREEDKKYKTLPGWKIKFALTEYGREGYYNKFNGDNFIAEKNSGYTEDGIMKITYLNDEKGMRQDFIVKLRPEGNSDKLVLKFKLNTKLKTEITQDGIKFLDRSNAQVMQYSSLYVADANGKVLNAKFQKVSSREYNIIVEDKEAVYPVTIDPLSTSPNWTAESNQAGAYFGYSVSNAGDVNGDGYSDVIVGAYYYDNGQTDEGRTFVYHGSASGLLTTANWTAESDQASAHFGCSVSTAGDVNGDGYSDVIVGAYYYDNGETDEGRAFVYHGSSSGLSLTQNWTAESDQASAYFGYSVSTAGDVNGDGYSDVIVGACAYDNGQNNEGRAFVYHGSASGLSATSNWTAESVQANAYFGCSVSTAGDVNGDGYSDVIVGANYYSNGQSNEGRVFVYHGSASGLSATANWTAESDQAGAWFGYSVSTAGDVNGDGYSDVIVGAYIYDGGQIDEGRAFVYHGSSSGLFSLTANWTAESNQ